MKTSLFFTIKMLPAIHQENNTCCAREMKKSYTEWHVHEGWDWGIFYSPKRAFIMHA
jgi:hypothetical protein